MSYMYSDLRRSVFTEEGQLRVLSVIRKARQCLELSGAVRAGILLSAAGSGDSGNSWEMMAAVDRLEELKMLRVITDSAATPAWQDRVFVAGSASL